MKTKPTKRTQDATSRRLKRKGVPDGYQLLAQTEIICAGDIVADCEGKWRGPVTHDWPGCGCPVSEYTVSKSGIGLPAVRGVARKHLPNDQGER